MCSLVWQHILIIHYLYVVRLALCPRNCCFIVFIVCFQFANVKNTFQTTPLLLRLVHYTMNIIEVYIVRDEDVYCCIIRIKVFD